MAKKKTGSAGVLTPGPGLEMGLKNFLYVV